ncbi:MAG: hypothetical protein ACREIN_01230 [Candidatus Methylomirabilaceae bacterium]
MKKAVAKAGHGVNDMRAEYDFTGGVRGKHYQAMQAGYTITIRKADGTTVIKEVTPKEGAVILEPGVRKYFPDSESVNTALRSLIRRIRGKRTATARNTRGAGTTGGAAYRSRSRTIKKV